MHDIKAAIRFLRGHAAEYGGYRTDRIAIVGASSGAHLAALVGVTNGNAQLEGTEGNDLKQSSSVQAIVSYFGASNLNTILAQSTPHGVNVREPALRRLLGGLPPVQASELATLASPVAHVSKTSPPLLLFHGDQDPQMPINQSHELEGAYKKLGLDVDFDVLHGAAHGGDAFFEGEALERAVKFLARTIGKAGRCSADSRDGLRGDGRSGGLEREGALSPGGWVCASPAAPPASRGLARDRPHCIPHAPRINASCIDDVPPSPLDAWSRPGRRETGEEFLDEAARGGKNENHNRRAQGSVTARSRGLEGRHKAGML